MGRGLCATPCHGVCGGEGGQNTDSRFLPSTCSGTVASRTVHGQCRKTAVFPRGFKRAGDSQSRAPCHEPFSLLFSGTVPNRPRSGGAWEGSSRRRERHGVGNCIVTTTEPQSHLGGSALGRRRVSESRTSPAASPPPAVTPQSTPTRLPADS